MFAVSTVVYTESCWAIVMVTNIKQNEIDKSVFIGVFIRFILLLLGSIEDPYLPRVIPTEAELYTVSPCVPVPMSSLSVVS